MDYNTQRAQIKLKEYGRSIQDITQYLKQIEDRNTRNSYAASVVELMKQLNPNVKDSPEYEQKVWDDLFIISSFDLDVDSPYPIPDATILQRKPNKVTYNSNNIKYKHYGRSIEILIGQAVAIEDKEEQFGAIVTIGKLMKSFYQNWNKETTEDEYVAKTIRELSGGKLEIDMERVKEYGLFDLTRREKEYEQYRRDQRNNNPTGGRQFHKGPKRNNQNNNRRRRPNI